METTNYRLLDLYSDNGKENGKYYLGLYWDNGEEIAYSLILAVILHTLNFPRIEKQTYIPIITIL